MGYARHWSVAKDRKLSLPIKSNGTPDFDYMERYIRAMEKVVIADVVKYTDAMILNCKIDKEVSDKLEKFIEDTKMSKTATVEIELTEFIEKYNKTGKI